MKEIMKWLVVNDEYLDYLRQFEKRIPYSDYGTDKYKPFFGVLFETEVFCYVTQISHAQKRHLSLKESKDFKKIYDPNTNNLISVVNLNYMFPILKVDKVELRYKDLDKYRTFIDEKEKNNYIALLNTEIKEIRNKQLDRDALWIYNNKYNNPDSFISKRCLDYKSLEQKCLIYKELKIQEQD